jgi:ABC-type nitrate/sulfonate/bicarbonate transport system permease component
MRRNEIKTDFSIGSVGNSRRLSWVGIVGFILIWVILSTFKIIDPLILPSPVRVLTAIHDVGLNLVLHILFTIMRVVVGLLLGSILGITIGVLMQYYRNVYVILDGIVETFRPVPPVALLPFIILIFGFSEIGKVVIVSLGVSLVMVVDTIESIERVPASLIRLGLVSGISRFSLFKKIILPAAWPEMRSGFRIALALDFTLVIVSEFMGATFGMGYLINVSKITLTTPTIILSIIILGILGWTFDKALRYLFNKTCFWEKKAKNALL